MHREREEEDDAELKSDCEEEYFNQAYAKEYDNFVAVMNDDVIKLHQIIYQYETQMKNAIFKTIDDLIANRDLNKMFKMFKSVLICSRDIIRESRGMSFLDYIMSQSCHNNWCEVLIMLNTLDIIDYNYKCRGCDKHIGEHTYCVEHQEHWVKSWKEKCIINDCIYCKYHKKIEDASGKILGFQG